MLYLIGLGLGDVTDITVKGLNIVKKCDEVYLEQYTSLLYDLNDVEKLEEFYGKKVIVADREMIEEQAWSFLGKASVRDVAVLVVGDPLGATTHTDLILRAVKKGIDYKIVHNASIITAAGCCGLQLYDFGATVSIPFWTDTWKPDSFLDKIIENKKRGLHTLCLLDIKVKEKSLQSLMQKKAIYEPPRFMSISQAADQLIQALESKGMENENCVFDKESYCVGLARVGTDEQKIVRMQLKDMLTEDFGKPLHSLIIEGFLHPLEKEMLSLFEKDNKVC